MSLLSRRRTMMFKKTADGLLMHYSLDSFDENTNLWVDECGTGAAITPTSLDADNNMIFCENARLLTMQEFSNLFENGWSICALVSADNNNIIMSLNSKNAFGTYPNADRRWFCDSADNYIWYGYVTGIKYYTFVYDADAETYTMYVDGVPIKTISKTTEWNEDTTSYFMIGGWGVSFGDIQAYNRPLSEKEVLQNYHSTM